MSATNIDDFNRLTIGFSCNGLEQRQNVSVSERMKVRHQEIESLISLVFRVVSCRVVSSVIVNILQICQVNCSVAQRKAQLPPR